MDDGFIHGGLSTNCFTLEEIGLLQSALKRYGINTRIYEDKKLQQFVLFITFESLKDFEELISPYMIESMKYKLRY